MLNLVIYQTTYQQGTCINVIKLKRFVIAGRDKPEKWKHKIQIKKQDSL